MDYEKELSKWGYNKNNSISVETLVSEILPDLLGKKEASFKELKQKILNDIFTFCEKEFNADFEQDWINGYGSKRGLSDRTEVFAEYLAKKINLD